MGFKSVSESLDTDMNRIRNNERNAYNEERRRVLDTLVDDPYDKEAQELAKEFGITGKQVREERKKKNQTYRERTESSMNKRQRQQYQYLMDFAQ